MGKKKNVFRYQTAKFNNEKLQLLLQQHSTSQKGIAKLVRGPEWSGTKIKDGHSCHSHQFLIDL